MSWIILITAGVFEVVWAVGLKYSKGFTQFFPSVVTSFAMIISFVLLGIAVRSLPVGTSYAIWTGIGSVGTVLAGIFLFHEPRDWGRICCIIFILIGVAGLRILSR
ncbi:MAG: multidrug efflux SMR transporter [Planctomycetia bacterium]|uniref:Guanidinium exporter n=1 Tax=Candidatus Brocadia sapporoensis TaxID=392547 RepID=A0A1V6LWR3_9BACT|nr:multidrug efflux SMR transporter [Candidatus Brocadia sapporoensis]MCC7238743.1 multidrug efflux SMR transporter [Candidatus Brocadia sp.]MEB2308144.1 multidrug efflux SMR transporter [Candidatus Brocadiaceae bacterium]OQZ04263.1 MAG: QacE family quaternary ammonium compound efflux SMR transporter [Candidatus Brocadia sp. UTAMX1]QOJ07590.1 MAG: multidrug efflux SMR transporter [Planctomycetia bacterium]RZV59393.1 MAG: multidrug efflux SMR transporter [Candidatus Brocadia sp. BROELEC01]TVL9